MFIARNKQKSRSATTNPSSNTRIKNNVSSSTTTTTTTTSSSKSSTPTTISIQGINVHFPFTPYPNQKTYMETVMKALHSSENALLESPTGTGKTLCLLCSTLAWQLEQRSNLNGGSSSNGLLVDGDVRNGNGNVKVNGNGGASQQRKVPTIIYASRTHSQLSQVVKEMRFTRYRPNHAVLGSREQMCIHPKVNPAKSSSSASKSKTNNKNNNINNSSNNSHDINTACTKLNKERKCRYRNNLEGFILTNENTTSTSSSTITATTLSEQQIQQPVLDIEELVQMGQKRSICPFYFTRNQISNADIIFIPYNYLFDTETRKNTLNEIEFENSIVIFDEAHNLESFASDSASFDLTNVDIGGCIVEVQRCIGYMQSMPELMDNGKDNSSGGGGSKLSMDNLLKLKSIFLQLEQYLDCKVPANGGSFSGEYIFEILQKGANITFQSHLIFLRFVRQVSECVMDMKGGGDLGGSGRSGRNATSSGTPKLDHFVSCIRKVFGSTEMISMARARSYRVHITPKSNSGPTSGTRGNGGGFVTNTYGSNQVGRKLSYWCFAPALAMNELAALKVRSILVTSGTLSPLPSYSLELGIPFPHMLENSHIIKKEQIAVRVVGTGVSGKALNSSFKRRDDSEYITELGNTIISLVRVIPGGVLIFFPSYGVMEKCIESWGGPVSSRSKARNYASKNNFFQARKRSNNQAAGVGIGRYCFPHSVLSEKNPSQWQRMLSLKGIILEPQSSSELKDVIEEFDKFISLPKSPGCIMMGVCRGKISEGIDFADEKCRAVIITGIPFAPYLDPKVKLKREYLDGIRTSMTTRASGEGGFDSNKGKALSTNMTLSGAEWYSQQAHRAVNQAIGRVIRHRFDYGSILFLDSRYSEPRNQLGTSKWIRPCFEPDKGVGPVIGSLVRFYRAAQSIVEERKRASKGPLSKPAISLRYEDESKQEEERKENNLGDSVTKVSFIKKDAEQKDTENGYIRPEQVIKNVELKHHKGGYASVKNDSSSLSKNDATRRRVELQKKLAKDVATDEKTNAKKFYQLAQKCLSSTDFKAMGKVLISMKAHGESKNSEAYLCKARDLLKILLLYDPSRYQNDKKERCDTLIEMLLPLLPTSYRFSIEKIACEIRYNQSTLRKECSEELEKDDYMILESKIPSIMVNHNRASEGNTSNERRIRNSYLGDIHTVIQVFMKNKKVDLLKHLYRLIPKHQIKTVKILVKDYQTAQRVKIMKEHERKRYGEEDIKNVLFQKPSALDIVVQKESDTPEREEDAREKKEALSRAGAIIMERKDTQKRTWHESRNNLLERSKRRKTTKTATATAPRPKNASKSVFDKMMVKPPKKARAEKSSSVTRKLNKTSPTKQGQDTVETCLQVASTERFQSSSKSRDKSISSVKSNAPNGTLCIICNTQAKDLYLSPCNHIACSTCWGNWLKRSETCPSCRKPIQKSELSKVVYHKESEKLPSLTQMCASSSDEDDDELEIIK